MYQAAFALLSLLHKRGVALDRVKDFQALVDSECSLAEYVAMMERSVPCDCVRVTAGSEEAVVKKLLECGVGAWAWGEA